IASSHPSDGAHTSVAPRRASAMTAEDVSPDSKCAICLDSLNNVAHLDCCLHRFCFPCVKEWSNQKTDCPVCRQPFATILQDGCIVFLEPVHVYFSEKT
uniref:RING-type E3 ubiquitin transferase n=1 Tax=Gouania willdenowi TaxID=441366 RepID=A0A8C5HLQ6_GOUWI